MLTDDAADGDRALIQRVGGMRLPHRPQQPSIWSVICDEHARGERRTGQASPPGPLLGTSTSPGDQDPAVFLQHAKLGEYARVRTRRPDLSTAERGVLGGSTDLRIIEAHGYVAGLRNYLRAGPSHEEMPQHGVSYFWWSYMNAARIFAAGESSWDP